jgi:hypothetical protein
MKTPTPPEPIAADLLRLADSIQGYARRLDNSAMWKVWLDRQVSAQAAGEQPVIAALLRQLQARRCAGTETDGAFFVICQMAERHADAIWDTDPELNELCDQMRAIEEREGLTDCEEFDQDDSETPAEWKALNAESNRRYQEVVRISDDRFIGWLRRHGENEIADLFLNNRAEYDRRREGGRFLVFGPQPVIKANIGGGDTGVSEVAKSQE